MGQQLLVGLGRQTISAPTPVERVPGKAIWRPLQTRPAELIAGPTSRAAATTGQQTGEIVDVTWSAAMATDPEDIITAVRSERVASWGGFDHPHAASGCGYCRRAAAAYR